MKIKGKKAQVQITLTPGSVEKARELGLNISKVAQNALDEAIRRLQTPVPQTETNGGYVDSRKAVSSAKVGSPGEIRTPVDGSKARHACPLQSAEHSSSTGLSHFPGYVQ